MSSSVQKVVISILNFLEETVWPTMEIHSIRSHSFYISLVSPFVHQSTAKLTGYKIIFQRLSEQGVLNETNMTVTVDRNTTNYRITGLERNTTYCVRILPYNECDDGILSNCSTVTTASGNTICGFGLNVGLGEG